MSDQYTNDNNDGGLLIGSVSPDMDDKTKINCNKFGPVMVLSEKSDFPIPDDIKTIRVILQDFKCCPFCGEKPILTVSNSEIITNVADEMKYSIYADLRVKCLNCKDVSMRSEHAELIRINASEAQLRMFGIKDLKDKWNQRKN